MAFSRCCRAATSLGSTKMISALASMNRRISHAVAVRFTWIRLRVTHFMISLLDVHAIERRPQCRREFHRIVVCPEVHEEEPRRLFEHVRGYVGDRDAAIAQNADHGIDF